MLFVLHHRITLHCILLYLSYNLIIVLYSVVLCCVVLCCVVLCCVVCAIYHMSGRVVWDILTNSSQRREFVHPIQHAEHGRKCCKYKLVKRLDDKIRILQ